MSEQERDQELLARHCAGLMEHFDSVRIVATKHNPVDQTTTTASWGQGNFHAQRDSTREWLAMLDEGDLERARANYRKEHGHG